MADDNTIEGARLGRYTLVRRLGKGGMGEVFLARATGAHGFEKQVAIKRILPQFSSNKQVVNMLVDEARISVRLNHPNVVQVLEFDVDEESGSHFIVMEYVDGHALSRLVRRVRKAGNTLEPLVACAVVIGVLDGLHAAHSEQDDDGRPARIIHRDISPQNVLLSLSGQVKVIDFGIARARDRLEATQGSQVKGKLRYMAPEQIKPSLAGVGGIDHRVDLFAAGTMLWELLAMRARYPQASDLDVIDAILEEPTPDLASEGLADRELMAIVATATQKDRRKRYKDAGEFGAALRAYLYARDPSFSPQQIARLMRRHFDAASAADDEPAPAAVASRARVVERPRPLLDDGDDHEVTRTQLRPIPGAGAEAGPAIAVRRPTRAGLRVTPVLVGVLVGLLTLFVVVALVRVAMRPRQLPVAVALPAGPSGHAVPPPSPTTPASMAASSPPPLAVPAPPAAPAAAPSAGNGPLELVVEVVPASARIALAYRPEPRYVTPARFRVSRGDVVDLLFEAEGYEPQRRPVLIDSDAPRLLVTLVPIPMPLLLRVVPRDAEVTVNGEPWRIGGTVKPDQDLVITATHPFFAPRTVKVRAQPGQALTVDVTLDERPTADLVAEREAASAAAPEPPARNLGRLVLSSRPPGADVFVDGKRAPQKTPLRLDVKPGPHKVTVRAPGAEQTFTVDVAAGAQVSREIVLD
ncbi:MAG: PEGA domain-containing protein [Deltaproteobacteria bacterium]|nr:PEGA domain-containing protein [Deltaproteobacteria bacterium]